MTKRKRRHHRSVDVRTNWLQPHVDDFKDWLARRNYSAATITEVVRLLALWADWGPRGRLRLGTAPGERRAASSRWARFRQPASCGPTENRRPPGGKPAGRSRGSRSDCHFVGAGYQPLCGRCGVGTKRPGAAPTYLAPKARRDPGTCICGPDLSGRPSAGSEELGRDPVRRRHASGSALSRTSGAPSLRSP